MHISKLALQFRTAARSACANARRHLTRHWTRYAAGAALAGSLAACAPIPPAVSGPTSTDNASIIGSCVDMRGTAIIGKGYITSAGDEIRTNGEGGYALLYNGTVGVRFDYTSSADYTHYDQNPRIAGLHVDAVWALAPNIAPPSVNEVTAIPALRQAAFDAGFVAAKFAVTGDVSVLGTHACNPLPADFDTYRYRLPPLRVIVVPPNYWRPGY
ncbi:MAG: hypothetical protein KGI37_09935 [Alphaproteobacteria bacterium]|nr:hypothetical protein [Alphaproteobacteria bacterium]